MSEWVSVKDRLPEDDSEYFIWHDYYKKIMLANFAPQSRARDFAVPMSAFVTHWMPLPEPPKVG